jgi:Protein of unknown function (DUF2971)
VATGDPALWAHYGARHRGICLGFDVKRESAKPVTYTSGRLEGKIRSGDLSLDADLTELLLTTKFKSWQYEEEYRQTVKLADAKEEGDLHFVGFGESFKLAEVSHVKRVKDAAALMLGQHNWARPEICL